MATLKINDLSQVGYDLLKDSESFLDELSDDATEVRGGLTPFLAGAALSFVITKAYFERNK